jgi:hypothetical protein
VTAFPSTAQAQARITAGVAPFVAPTFGNQRRTLEQGTEIETLSELTSTVKGGLHIQLRPGLMVAPAAGITFNPGRNGTSGFAEIEVNHTFRTGGYAGTGVGVWDLADRSRTAATVLIHFGAPLLLRGPGRAGLLVTYETRLFFGQLNNIDNNYQALVGIRYVFR